MCAPLSSRKSQACARLQSRLTVPTDTSSTCAVSSRLNPAKNRSSTTRLWRGLSVSSVFSASSSATRSMSGPAGTPAASDSVTWSWPWPRLARSRGPRHVDQHAPHDLRRHGEEVGAVLPARVLPVDQPQVGFVDQRRRLQEVARPLSRHVARREAVQLLLDHRRQRVERGLVASAPGHEQLGDIGGGVHGRFPGPSLTNRPVPAR